MAQQPSSGATGRLVPVLVILLCLPLPMVAACGALALSIERVNNALSTLLKLVFFFGYLLLILPAMYVIEPFVVIATIWYSTRATGESARRVFTCWFAVAIHTIVLVWFLVNNAPRR
jgi:hypothetical protein